MLNERISDWDYIRLYLETKIEALWVYDCLAFLLLFLFITLLNINGGGLGVVRFVMWNICLYVLSGGLNVCAHICARNEIKRINKTPSWMH